MEINNITLDHEYYRESYLDLRKFSDSELEQHFKNHGIDEGRISSFYSLRENLISLILNKGYKSLEIGPFFAPALRGKNVFYFDALTTSELISRAKKLNIQDANTDIDINNIPDINYSDPEGNLNIINDSFDVILSSHCIEHQPNLIKHLNDVFKLLNDRGRYFVIIPDKRYCFDHYLPTSNIAEIIQADYENRTIHSLRNVIEHRSLLTHNDSIEHWKGNHGHISNDNIMDRLSSAVSEYETSNSQYIDVHAWQFTPQSMHTILTQLEIANKISFSSKKVFTTPWGRNEFIVILEK